MKKTVVLFIVSCILVTACHKHQSNPVSPTPAAIVGNWHIDSVTTYFYDFTGINNIGMQGYGNFQGYFFNFNADNSWNETIQDTTLTQGITSGTYTITSDSTFTLLNPHATARTAVEPCKIISVTNNMFIFSKQLPTLFNGRDSGYIKYVFRLLK